MPNEKVPSSPFYGPFDVPTSASVPVDTSIIPDFGQCRITEPILTAAAAAAAAAATAAAATAAAATPSATSKPRRKRNQLQRRRHYPKVVKTAARPSSSSTTTKKSNINSSSSPVSSTRSNTTASNLFATTAAMTNLVVSTASSSLLSSSPGTSSTGPADSGQNDCAQKKNKEAAATSPSPSSSPPPPPPPPPAEADATAATATTETSPPPSSSPSQTTRASSTDEDNTTTEVGAAAATATPVPMPIYLQHHTTMTTRPPPPPSSSPVIIETKRTAMNVEDATPTAVAAAAAEAALPPSTEDPQAEECVLCAYPLPLKEKESVYQACCGHTLCKGCMISHRRVLILGENVEKPTKGSKAEEREFKKMLLSKESYVCPFCRKPVPINGKEVLKRLWERIDEYRDPEAMLMLGGAYLIGKNGLSKNIKTAEELYKRSHDLGNPNAAYFLANIYHEHIHHEARMIQYAEEGVRRGNVACMTAVGEHAHQSGNYEEATRHFMMAARSGDEEAMKNLTKCYRHELVSKEDLATTLRAHQAAHVEEKSESREYGRRYWDYREKVLAAAGITNRD